MAANKVKPVVTYKPLEDSTDISEVFDYIFALIVTEVNTH